MPVQNFDVTAANAELAMTIEEIAPSGISLEMFAADTGISSDAVEFTETRKGVDGKMVGGVIKNIYPVTINLEASSPTVVVFERLRDVQNRRNHPYLCQLTVYYPSIDKSVTFTNGVLKSGPVIQTMGRTLQPTSWRFDFEDVK